MTDCNGPENGGGDEPGRVLVESERRTDEQLTPGAIFGILASERNRFLLYLLEERGGTIALDELATAIAARENDTEPGLVTEEAKRRTRNRLHHASVPKLADHGLVAVQDSEAVTLTDPGRRLGPYLDFAREREQQDVQAFLERTGRDTE